MRVLTRDATWKTQMHHENIRVSCEDTNISSDTICICFYGAVAAPHITFYGWQHESYKSFSLKLDNKPCTFKSREAFVLALAIELQSRYNSGDFDYSEDLGNKIDQLRIEYLQPIDQSI